MHATATQPEPQSTRATSFSSLGFAIAVTLLLFNGAMLIYIAPRYLMPIFGDFDIPLPLLTFLIFADTSRWIGILSGLLSVALSGIVIATRCDKQSMTVCAIFGLALSVPVSLWLVLGLLMGMLSVYASV